MNHQVQVDNIKHSVYRHSVKYQAQVISYQLEKLLSSGRGLGLLARVSVNDSVNPSLGRPTRSPPVFLFGLRCSKIDVDVQNCVLSVGLG